MKYTILLIILIQGCGTVEYPDQSEFLPYTKLFYEVTGEKPRNIPIIFADLPDNKVGVCHTMSSGYKYIRIDKKSWSKYNIPKREVLILHELGHCLLDRRHRDEMIDLHGEFCPASIMRYMLFTDSQIENCYEPFYAYYMEELR